MRKYFLVAKNTWDEMVTYRLNFAMWRLRNVLQLLTVYFLWLAIIPQGSQVFGYSQSLMLTYVLGTSFVGSIIFSSRSHEIGENINKGDLSIFLIRPIKYLWYWFARDIGDKLFNISFAIAELTILFLILRPPLFLQSEPFYLSFFLIAIALGLILNFLTGVLMGFIGFWSPETWGIRFISYILGSFLAGGLFPLDILPKSWFIFFQLLPFPYLLYFPLKIYLGQINSQQLFTGLFISVIWIIIFSIFVKIVWLRGLRIYTAEGR